MRKLKREDGKFGLLNIRVFGDRFQFGYLLRVIIERRLPAS